MKDPNNSLTIVLLYLVVGLAFGQGLVMLLMGDGSELPLVVAGWLAAALLLFGNYRRLTRHSGKR